MKQSLITLCDARLADDYNVHACSNSIPFSPPLPWATPQATPCNSSADISMEMPPRTGKVGKVGSAEKARSKHADKDEAKLISTSIQTSTQTATTTVGIAMVAQKVVAQKVVVQKVVAQKVVDQKVVNENALSIDISDIEQLYQNHQQETSGLTFLVSLQHCGRAVNMRLEGSAEGSYPKSARIQIKEAMGIQWMWMGQPFQVSWPAVCQKRLLTYIKAGGGPPGKVFDCGSFARYILSGDLVGPHPVPWERKGIRPGTPVGDCASVRHPVVLMTKRWGDFREQSHHYAIHLKDGLYLSKYGTRAELCVSTLPECAAFFDCTHVYSISFSLKSGKFHVMEPS